MRLFCDLDCTLNNAYIRIKECSSNGECNWSLAYSPERLMLDEPNVLGRIFLKRFKGIHKIIIITARNFNNARDLTQNWLDDNGFPYDELVLVKKPSDKIKYLKKTDFLIDDFSRGHENFAPYKCLDWETINELNVKNKNYYIFDGNWEFVSIALEKHLERI